MQTLTQLKSPGSETTQWLNAMSIDKADDLDAMGDIDGCRIPGAQAYPACLKPADTIVAALWDIPWTRLPPDIR